MSGQNSSGYRLFFRESIRSLGPTASVVPSSRFLAAALTKPIDFHRARTIIELGPGTGPVTKSILRHMHRDARLLAVDINASFIDHLRRTCADRRLIAMCASATDLSKLLAEHKLVKADAVVSSLGLTSMGHDLRSAVLRQIGECLTPEGLMTQFQYVHAYPGHLDVENRRFSSFNELRFLRHYFRSIRIGHVLLNFPPALVFTCREYRGKDAGVHRASIYGRV